MQLRRLAVIAYIVLALWFGCGTGCLIGSQYGERAAYLRNCDEQRDAIARVLAANPAFADVGIDQGCDAGWVTLWGRVRTEADWGLLRRELSPVDVGGG